ncbi:alpha-N-acetylglucosaminidase-like [Anneissia japonica]|uniref:alpha-N-acetylglucosaminidase-like n=1 Tax=Anneissia japonica TaxID=1529436 RepID=UPI001425A590|nr:alpha-N-acetylglucosaminidase-like [Anneissia japonica]
MLLHNLTFFCILIILVQSHQEEKDLFPKLNLRSKTLPDVQAQAASDVISRILPPDRALQFKVSVDSDIGPAELTSYKFSSDGKTVHITGTSGVAVVWGFHHYLKHYCDCHISWQGRQLNLPTSFPVVDPEVFITSPNKVRYYQNVCTVSYSFAFWNWTRWEKHIDWMALNGINLPLAFTAQESIWEKVYLKLGFTQQDLDVHFGGPAFLAWTRMGNINGWGGPLPSQWHYYQLDLQHRILNRMRSLGMIPVLPAFAGHVPNAITRLFPNASVTRLRNWGHFSDPYCCTYLLDSQDPLFKKIGTAFVEAMIDEYNGTDHVYNGDLFNEMTPSSSDPNYLSAASRGVYDAIVSADPKGVWLMQAWLFTKGTFWTQEAIKAFLGGVPEGKLILLDLQAESQPVYNRSHSFFGQPFIWCMLHNFGGNSGMYGMLEAVNQGPFDAMEYSGSSMIGTGLTPEGINQNYIMYDFMTDLMWRTESVDIQKWITNYALRRYGSHSAPAAQALLLLAKSVYNCTDAHENHCKAVVVQRPQEQMSQNIWYSVSDVTESWQLMLQAVEDIQASSLFRYDIVDVTRQVLQDVAYSFYNELIDGYQANNSTAVKTYGDKLLDLLLDMDAILLSHEDWLLGRWLLAAKLLASNAKDQKLYEFNARNQITLWGPNGEILDYGNKQWGGLLKSYYYDRWKLYIDTLLICIETQQKLNQTAFNEESLEQGRAWTKDTTIYPTLPTGDSIKISRQLFNKYERYFKATTQMFNQEISLRNSKETKYELLISNHK